MRDVDGRRPAVVRNPSILIMAFPLIVLPLIVLPLIALPIMVVLLIIILPIIDHRCICSHTPPHVRTHSRTQVRTHAHPCTRACTQGTSGIPMLHAGRAWLPGDVGHPDATRGARVAAARLRAGQTVLAHGGSHVRARRRAPGTHAQFCARTHAHRRGGAADRLGHCRLA